MKFTKEFIEQTNQQTDQINSIILSISDKLELDWRDSGEIEIHNFDSTIIDPTTLIDLLYEKGFIVDSFNFRYEQTLRIYFKDNYYGSYGLENYTQDELDELESIQ